MGQTALIVVSLQADHACPSHYKHTQTYNFHTSKNFYWMGSRYREYCSSRWPMATHSGNAVKYVDTKRNTRHKAHPQTLISLCLCEAQATIFYLQMFCIEFINCSQEASIQPQPALTPWQKLFRDDQVKCELLLGLGSAGREESVVAECPHEDLMAEAEEEGFSNYRVVNRHFQLNTQASTSPSPKMPPKAFENPTDLAQAAKDYGRDTQREQMSYISQTGSAGQKACLREEGLSTSNINKAFLDAAKDILKNN
ncbi:hypothetical protein PROFUN_16489 [Planoprotostelium fungivorum]|uniref:Uncharacterized protein n=1 Tax=Planoprotostelium fungivorum TaxID=1890364 RepID=A0A2P6MQL2_9EUKA|nr:hypothetical protein PROFUN_16489 [Planoprotostelium fungivorum]